MNYKIKEIATIAGISTRTLRYYDQIGLLKPSNITNSNYRLYNSSDVDLLQQITLYKRLGFTLTAIKEILQSNTFNREYALEEQKKKLIQEQQRIALILSTIDQSLQTIKGGTTMKDVEKFKGLIEEKIAENDINYGDEIRLKYGSEAVDASYQHMRKMSKWELQQADTLSVDILSLLGSIYTSDPSSVQAMKLCQMHQQWIQLYWPQYSEDAHMQLVEMYTLDPRFTAYYDCVGSGATQFLYQAMKRYLKRDSR